MQDIQNQTNHKPYDDTPNKENWAIDTLAMYEIDEPATDVGLELLSNFNTVDLVQNIKLSQQNFEWLFIYTTT